MVTVAPGFLDRIDERRTLDRLLAAVHEGQSAVVVIRGEAGIGKTALLRYAADHASGFLPLQVTGAEAEMELPFAGIHQLCAPALLDRLDTLVQPQHDALAVALGLASGDVPERFRNGEPPRAHLLRRELRETYVTQFGGRLSEQPAELRDRYAFTRMRVQVLLDPFAERHSHRTAAGQEPGQLVLKRPLRLSLGAEPAYLQPRRTAAGNAIAVGPQWLPICAPRVLRETPDPAGSPRTLLDRQRDRGITPRRDDDHLSHREVVELVAPQRVPSPEDAKPAARGGPLPPTGPHGSSSEARYYAPRPPRAVSGNRNGAVER